MSSRAKKIVIYMDNAAATPIDPKVQKEMTKAGRLHANPSSFNDVGRSARKKIDESRIGVARFLGTRPSEIVFTSSGSEANNMAIFGLAKACLDKKEIITSPIEHPSILEPIRELGRKGFKIKYLKINQEGMVDLKDLETKLSRQTLLVSVMYANNEIGTIQPIKMIAKIVKAYRSRKLEIHEKAYPLFHVDACQAAGYLDMNVNNLGVDMLTFNGAKIYGPRGIGLLYLKNGIPIRPLIFGGDQEHGLRAGTENLLAIVGLAKAVSLINKNDGKKITGLRDYFLERVKEIIPEIRINGPAFTKVSAVGSTKSAFGQTKSAGKPTGSSRLASNINISVSNLNSENLLLELDKYGIYASAGSACTARSVEPSHVLKAIGAESRYLNGALRFSLGRQTTKKEIDYVLKVLPRIIWDLRKRYKK